MGVCILPFGQQQSSAFCEESKSVFLKKKRMAYSAYYGLSAPGPASNSSGMDSVGSSRRSSAHSMPDVDRCGLEEEQVKSLKRTFDQFDKEKQGAISVGTVETILKMMGMHVSSKDLEDIIQEIDEDGSGELEFPEFIQLAAKFLIEEDEEEMKWELKEAFRLYDKQGNGYITTNTLKEILREIDSNLTEYNLDQIVEEVDADGSGTIDFDEFMAMMTGDD